MFVIVFIRARHWTQSTISHPISLRPILISYFHLRLGPQTVSKIFSNVSFVIIPSSFIRLYEGVPKSFRTGRLERELQMIQLSVTRCSLYSYFVSQSSEFCRHNPLCRLSTSFYCCRRIFRCDSVRKLLDKPSYVTFETVASLLILSLFNSVLPTAQVI